MPAKCSWDLVTRGIGLDPLPWGQTPFVLKVGGWKREVVKQYLAFFLTGWGVCAFFSTLVVVEAVY